MPLRPPQPRQQRRGVEPAHPQVEVVLNVEDGERLGADVVRDAQQPRFGARGDVVGGDGDGVDADEGEAEDVRAEARGEGEEVGFAAGADAGVGDALGGVLAGGGSGGREGWDGCTA